MLSGFLRLLGFGPPPPKRRRPADAGDSVYIPSQPTPVQRAASLNQGIETTRELFRINGRDVAREHGIPTEWLTCEVLTITKQQKVTFQVKMQINHWDEQLLLFSRAFELAYVERIRGISPQAAEAFNAMVWCIAKGVDCPYDKLPEKEYWGEEARNERETLQRFRDVERLMSLTKPLEPNFANQATEPMPLDEKRPLIAGQIIID